MNPTLINQLANLYHLSAGPTLEDAIQLIEQVAAANRACFIMKFDGERASNRFTVVFNSIDLTPHIVRMDGESLYACMNAVVKMLIELKQGGKIQ